MTALALREFGAPVAIELAPREIDALHATNESWRKSLGLPVAPLRILQQGSQVLIGAQGVAGTMKVGSLTIEIAPKFLGVEQDAGDWRHAFWQILIIAQQGKSVLGKASGRDIDTVSIADVLAELFLRSYSRGTTRGLPLQYTEAAEIGPSVHGSFDPEGFVRWTAQPWKVPSKASVLTVESPLSQLMSWAASQLRTLTTSRSRARELDEVRQSIVFHSRRPPRLDVAERIQLGVQHEALRPALEIAILLLRGHGVRQGDGERDVIGFLWRSEDVYERFLFWLCREAARKRGLSVRKSSARFGVSSTAAPLTTTPDVTFTRSDATVVAVLDAKYKRINSTPAASDSYQILTSANHFGCRRVGLVYPSTDDRPETVWTVASALGGLEVQISALHLELLRAATLEGRRALVDVVGDWLDGLGAATFMTDLEVAAPRPADVETDAAALSSNHSTQSGH